MKRYIHYLEVMVGYIVPMQNMVESALFTRHMMCAPLYCGVIHQVMVF